MKSTTFKPSAFLSFLASVAVFAMLQHYNDYLNPLIYINDIKLWTMPLGIAALNANQSYAAGILEAAEHYDFFA